MSADDAYKLHLQDRTALISAANAYELEALAEFIKPAQSLLGKWLNCDGSVRYKTLAELTKLHNAHITFYSVVKVLASIESEKDERDFASALLGSSHLNSASLAIGVAVQHLRSAAGSLR